MDSVDNKIEIPQIKIIFLIFADAKLMRKASANMYNNGDDDNGDPLFGLNLENITHILGIQPTHTSPGCGFASDCVHWEYSIEEKTWDPTELLYDFLKPFKPEKIKQLPWLNSLELEIQVKATVTKNNFPSLYFANHLLERIAELGAGLDIDIVQTAGS